jgi:4-hydroxy-tetrahydrodipicolinate reductase
MRFGIVGAGKMGCEIETMAGRRGHDVVWKLDSGGNARGAGLTPERLSRTDVVFEFTSPASAPTNLDALARAGATVVCGTTGWDRDLPRITAAFQAGNGALV